MQLAHPGQGELARFGIGFGDQRWILLAQPQHCLLQLLPIFGGLRRERDGDHGFGEFEAFQEDGVGRVAERVAGDGVFHAHEGDYIAGRHPFHLLAAVGVHPVDASHALLGAGAGIEDLLAGVDLPGEDAHPGEMPDVRIADDLERERAEGGGKGIRAFEQLLFVCRMMSQHRAHVHGSGEVGDDGVEQRLDADAIAGHAAQHRHEVALNDGLAQCRLPRLERDLFPFQVTQEQGLVGLGDAVEQVFPSPGDLLSHLRRNGAGGRIILPRLPEQRLPCEQVHDPPEIALDADGQFDGDGLGGEAFLCFGEHALKIRADAVELVHENQPGQVLVVRVQPDGFGLRLYAADAAEDDHRAVNDAN